MNVSDNEIGAIPNILSKITNLEELMFGNNKLMCLPQEISNLEKLRKLYVPYNSIDQLPQAIATSVTKLNTVCCHLESAL